MISINTLKINNLTTEILVDVNTVVGNKITKVLVWDSATFKNYEKAIDLTTLLKGDNEKESFSILSQTHLNVDKIIGLWFVEFSSDEQLPDNKVDTMLGVTANFLSYHECILNKLLKANIDDCKLSSYFDCDECKDNIFYINTLITTLNETVKFGYYEESIKIIQNLDELCDICHNCPNYTDTQLINGSGLGTQDNSIILI